MKLTLYVVKQLEFPSNTRRDRCNSPVANNKRYNDLFDWLRTWV